MSKRPASPPPPAAPKRARAHILPTLDGWLSAPPRLLASSPHLHASTSTFIGFTLPFVPASHVRDIAAVTREARKAVRELDVVSLVGGELIARSEGAFADGQARAPTGPGRRQRAREPDCRMWAVRTLCLGEGRDGTGGEGDYQLIETSDDDGEKFGGERILRVLKEQGGVDVLTICCRWFGGDMLGPARFHHIGITSQHSLSELQRLVALRDLRAELVRLDAEIEEMRGVIAARAASASAASGSVDSRAGNATDTAVPSQATNNGNSDEEETNKVSTPTSAPAPVTAPRKQTYDDIEDVPRLERLVRAKEKSRANLEARVAAG